MVRLHNPDSSIESAPFPSYIGDGLLVYHVKMALSRKLGYATHDISTHPFLCLT